MTISCSMQRSRAQLRRGSGIGGGDEGAEAEVAGEAVAHSMLRGTGVRRPGRSWWSLQIRSNLSTRRV